MSIIRYTCEQCGDVYWTGDAHDCPYDAMPMAMLRSEWQEVIAALRASAARGNSSIACAIERNLEDVYGTTVCVRRPEVFHNVGQV